MRQIVLDTETTGLNPALGHRIIEIGCVEIHERRLTGNTFQCYINPERTIDPGAEAVHGISLESLQDKPKFSEICDDFLAFVRTDELIIHNAPFDLGFLKHELKRIPNTKPLEKHCSIFDTLTLARKKHPGQKNNLDALCKRYGIDNSKRGKHGALLDAEILALVYLAMTAGTQGSLFDDDKKQHHTTNKARTHRSRNTSSHKVIKASDAERKAHQVYMELLAEKTEQE